MVPEQKVPPQPDAVEPPLWAPKDALARGEERFYPDEQALKGQKAQNDITWLKAYGVVIVVLMVVFALLFILSIVAWAWHYITPTYWSWLIDDQLSKIKTVIFSGSLGGIVSIVAQKQLSK